MPCSLRKCSSLRFLPRTPSAFQQGSLTAFRTRVPLGRAVILGLEEDNFENCLWTGFSCWESGVRSEKTVGQLYTGLCGEVVEEIGDPLER